MLKKIRAYNNSQFYSPSPTKIATFMAYISVSFLAYIR